MHRHFFRCETMAKHQSPNSTSPQPHPSSSSSSSSSSSGNLPSQPSSTAGSSQSRSEFSSGSGHKGRRYPNPPESSIPDPVTLREQWKFAIRQYSRWYSQAWGTAILAGVSFFALGWIIKGRNPLPSLEDISTQPPPSSPFGNDSTKEAS